MSDVLGRSIAFPPRVGADGRVAWSQGEANIRESVEIILRTEPGERLRRPDFGAGLARSLFDPNTTATRHRLAERIDRALAAWEPRIVVESVEVAADPADPSAAHATVTYRLVATGARERVVLTVPLGG